MIVSASRPPEVYLSRQVLMSLVASCGIVGEDAANISAEFAATARQTLSKAEVTDLLIALIGRCADDRYPISYLCVPITTGRAHIEWHAQHGHTPDVVGRSRAGRKGTMAANRRRGRETADRLRAILTGTVIDPSRLADVPGWEQTDYHFFWTRVIERYAEKVLFSDGWQYSVGCVIEFAKAVQLGLPTLTEHLIPLDATAGKRLVRAAIDEYDAVGLNAEALRQSLSIADGIGADAPPRKV